MAESAIGPRFADVGGMEEAKAQVRQVVENRLPSGKFGEYGVGGKVTSRIIIATARK